MDSVKIGEERNRRSVARCSYLEPLDPQHEHVFRVLNVLLGVRELQALLRDITGRAFVRAGADQKPLRDGFPIVQLIRAASEIAMADANRGPSVAHVPIRDSK